MKMTPRSEAKQKGLSRYFTGKPCPRGHVCERWTDNGNCVDCRIKGLWRLKDSYDDDTGLKLCRKCDTRKPLSHFSKLSANTKNGRNAHCRDCFSNFHKVYRKKTSSNISAKYNRDSRKRHPEKFKARAKLAYAIKIGKIIKPTQCSKCLSCSGKLHGHHHDYEKPLDVTWLCNKCHGEEHRIYA